MLKTALFIAFELASLFAALNLATAIGARNKAQTDAFNLLGVFATKLSYTKLAYAHYFAVIRKVATC